MTILQQIAWLAAAFGAMMAGMSTFFAYLTFRRQSASFIADHERSKKASAVDLILQWNQNTLIHRRSIETAFPGLLDRSTSRGVVELTKQQATNIYNSDPKSPDWELRFNLIELLNFFEAVAVAFESGVADRKLIEDSFRGVLRNYYEALHNFIVVVKESRGLNPWEPYVTLIRRWEPELPELPPPPDKIT